MGDQQGLSRGGLLTLGVILILAGVAALSLPFVAALALALLMGWVFIICGIMQCVYSFWTRGWGRLFIRLLIGLLYCAAGIMLLTCPLGGILTLTLILAILFLVEGICKVVASVQNRNLPNWGWMLFSGILSLFIGGFVYAEWPSSAVWAIGLLVGINILFRGWSMVMHAAAMRSTG